MRNLQDEIASLQEDKATLEKKVSDLEKRITQFQNWNQDLENYVPDPDWPGTATHKDKPSTRVCEACLILKRAALRLIHDPTNRCWGCPGCKVQHNKPQTEQEKQEWIRWATQEVAKKQNLRRTYSSKY